MLKRLYSRFRAALVARIIARAERMPYEHLAGYMERYWLLKPSRWTGGIGVRVHRILRSDNDRDMHTHPWWFLTWRMLGQYWEVLPAGAGKSDVYVGGYVNLREPFRIAQRKQGSFGFHRRSSRHKLMLFRGPVWTLVIHGPDHGSWGYYVPGTGLVDRRLYRPNGTQP